MIVEDVSEVVMDVVDFAKTIAKDYSHSQFSSCHLMKSVLRKEAGLVPFMDGIHKDISYMREWADVRIEGYPKGSSPVPVPDPDSYIDAVLREADFVKLKLGRSETDATCLIVALCTPGVGFSYEQLKSFPLTRNDVMDNIDAPKAKSNGGLDSNATAGSSANSKGDAKSIGDYCIDKTELALSGKIDPIVGRDKEVRQISEILGRRSKPNVIIVGDPGVGKTALIDGFALNINSGNVPSHLKDARLFELDLGALVAGASYKGEVEDRIKKVVRGMKSYDKAILFIDEIHALMDENRGLSGCANLLKPELARGELTVIGATTNDEYREFLEPEEAFMRRFEIVRVEEPTDDVCHKMLEVIVPFYEDHHSLKVEEPALGESIRLARRYLKERRLPDAAIDLIDRTLASIRMMNDTSSDDIDRLVEGLTEVDMDDDKTLERLRYFDLEMKSLLSPVLLGKLDDETDVSKIEDPVEIKAHLESMLTRLKELSKDVKEEVHKEDIAAIVAYKTGIPMGKVQSQEKERLLNIEETIKKRVIGQDHAIKILADSILESRSGLTKANLPTGSFFFLGSTGTGKTELAKALAEFLFADENSLIRFDMSEFKEEHSAALLYGAPPGYVGYKEGGLLVNKIRQKPYSIVLFDEIEKAHPSVFDLFLQILDEGKLHDRLGKEGDFSNAVILFTSNIGSDHIIEEFEKGVIPKSSDLLEIMSSHFRPEFLARLTEILPFRPINEETVEFIFDLQLKELEKALDKQQIQLEVDKDSKKRLAMEGFTPKYGARPLRGVIRNRLRRPISRMIIGQKVTKGHTIHAAFNGDELEFNIEETKQP